uniref:Uncharacterized protein n=1 Tax=Arundo donax TaxID=35708 RepID=A0A0A8ZWR1_ARUDO
MHNLIWSHLKEFSLIPFKNETNLCHHHAQSSVTD